VTAAASPATAILSQGTPECIDYSNRRSLALVTLGLYIAGSLLKLVHVGAVAR
jgi:hypothetical protein